MIDKLTLRAPLTRDRFDLIRQAVALHFLVTTHDITAPNRGTPQVAAARLALYALLYERTSADLLTIARWCGRYHHTTVLDGIQRTRGWAASAPAYWQAFQAARCEAVLE